MNIYKRHRSPQSLFGTPPGSIHRFNPSHLNIEDLLKEKGVEIREERSKYLRDFAFRGGVFRGFEIGPVDNG